MSDVPEFLLRRDPDYRYWQERMQWAYAQRGAQDRAMRLNYGWGTQPFTVEDALVWAERRAEAMLTRRWTP